MSATRAWVEALADILAYGENVSPRGSSTREILHRTMTMDMRRPVMCLPTRSLHYRFMAAEAYWILTGDSLLSNIAPWNSRIKDFSDDGTTFFGAYGPMVMSQLSYVVGKLKSDPATRQAGLTIWRQNPPQTKDYPCTIAMWFQIREGKLNCHVFMRSSDAWLGVPYDVFNFSMISHMVCARLNVDSASTDLVEPGRLYLTAASAHLYQPNWEDARACSQSSYVDAQPMTPRRLWNDEHSLMETLRELRDTKPGHNLRWWEVLK